MPRDRQHVVNLRAREVVPDSQRTLRQGTLLQFGLRAVLIVFVVATLLWEPPARYQWVCVAVAVVYLVVIGCWSVWALRSRAPTAMSTRTPVALLVLTAPTSTEGYEKLQLLAVLGHQHFAGVRDS